MIDGSGSVHQIVAVPGLRTGVITLFVACGMLAAVTDLSAAANSIVVKDLNGRQLTFFAEKTADGKPTVFIFVLPDCPVCNSYMPELKRLRKWRHFARPMAGHTVMVEDWSGLRLAQPAQAGARGTARLKLLASHQAAPRKSTPAAKPKQRKARSLVPNNSVYIRTVIGNRIGNPVN